MGAPIDKVEGLKWHIVAKTAGKSDLMLDEALAQATPVTPLGLYVHLPFCQKK